MAQISELLKALQQGNGGFTQPQSPFQLDAPAPAAPPTVGPTVANAAALPQAPSPAGAFDPSQFFGGRDAGNTIGLPDVAAAGQIRQPEQAPNALLDLAEREGALGPKMSDIFSGRETAISEGGVAAPIASPVTPTELGGIPSGLGGEDVFGSTPAPTPSAGVSPTAPAATPTSGSGIGTSVVNDVNFLQEGMKQMQAPQPQGLTTAGGQPLAEFLAGGQQLDAQGRMIDPNVNRSSFEKESAAREARMDQRPDFGTAVSDRERRMATGEGTSMADLTDMAKANARGASPRDIARGQKIANELGVDLKTGQPLEARGGVSAKDAAEIRKTEAETAKVLSEINANNSEVSEWSDGRKQAMKTQAKELAEWEINELPKLKANISQLDEAANLLEDKQIRTGTFGEQVPVLGEWARPFLNPDAEVAQQQISGVIMQSLKETFPGAISNEERKALISTIYNPRLKPEQNAELVRGYMKRLNSAIDAKSSQTEHFRKFGNLENYEGPTPRQALMGGVQVGDGGIGSPIEGDVNIKEFDNALL